MGEPPRGDQWARAPYCNAYLCCPWPAALGIAVIAIATSTYNAQKPKNDGTVSRGHIPRGQVGHDLTMRLAGPRRPFQARLRTPDHCATALPLRHFFWATWRSGRHGAKPYLYSVYDQNDRPLRHFSLLA